MANERTRRMDALHGRRPSRDSDSGDNRMMDALKEYWAIVAGAVAALVWLVRLEAQGKANEKEIKRLWEQRKEDLDNAKVSREALIKSIEDQTAMLNEVRQDIKTILSSGR
jgi:seryl-tRNA synthetase